MLPYVRGRMPQVGELRLGSDRIMCNGPEVIVPILIEIKRRRKSSERELKSRNKQLGPAGVNTFVILTGFCRRPDCLLIKKGK